MSNITRRSFITAAGAFMGVGALAGLTGCAPKARAETAGVSADAAKTVTGASTSGFIPGGGSFAEGALDLGWAGTPEAIEAVGGSTMPLAELNRRRKAYIDSKTEDFICADGSTIPSVYVKVAAKINSIGTGTLEAADQGYFPESSLRAIIADINEEQAQFYIDLPTDVNFNVVDASLATGKSIEESAPLLSHLHACGYLAQHERNDGTVYHCFPFFQGLAEMFTLNHYQSQTPLPINDGGAVDGFPATGTVMSMLDQGTPVFHAVPVNAEVMAEGSTILSYEDVREIVKTKKKLSLGPCTCRWMKARGAGSTTLPPWEDFVNRKEGCYEYYDETIGQYIENCIYMDDEAENGIAMGWCHEATAEEVLAVIDRSAEAGYILHVAGGKRMETICCCSVDAGCGMCNVYDRLGDAVMNYPAWDQKHRYMLEIDKDVCTGCGTCVTRCPMHAVSMGEDGKPMLGPTCLSCGQCATTCPVQARKLSNRVAESLAELPESFVEDNMIKAAYRFEHGLIV